MYVILDDGWVRIPNYAESKYIRSGVVCCDCGAENLGIIYHNLMTFESKCYECYCSRWVSVVRRTPIATGYSKQYLVRLMNGDYVVANWMGIGGWDFDPTQPITHWCSIPECPILEVSL